MAEPSSPSTPCSPLGALGETKKQTQQEVFVPGRLCLFGEHSDWSGAFRRFNPEIAAGATLVLGTTQGLYATARAAPDISFVATDGDGRRVGPWRCAADRAALLAEAAKGGFFSYVAGVAAVVLTNHRVGGLAVDQHTTTLPLKKGLSSSAAVCVLVARAFNRCYGLKLSTRGEMEYAYQGEIATPSSCGRMDQACAFGSQPTLLTYDGDRLEVEAIAVAKPIRLMIVDLGQEKDTPLMLRSLQRSFPGPPTDDVGRNVHAWLGEANRRRVDAALAALRAGDAAALGAFMDAAMADFDRLAAPECPAQFAAPTLHAVLADPTLRRLCHGGKGVGCGGEGSAQLVCKSEAARAEALAYVSEQLGMWCCGIDVGGSRGVTRAVIPAAGYHGALFPASHVTPSPLWPVVDDRDGLVKPAILLTIEELVDRAGVEEVVVVVQRGDVGSYERALMRTPLDEANEHRLNEKAAAYAARARRLGERVALVVQDRQEGLGHALLCARDFLARRHLEATRTPLPEEPVLVVLGDHLYREASTVSLSCAQQLLAAQAEHPDTAAVAVARSTRAEAGGFGVVAAGARERSDDGCPAFAAERVVEKPGAAEAAALAVEELGGDLLTCFGMYVLPSRTFDYLDDDVRANRRCRGVFGLTPALSRLAADRGLRAILVEGTRFDFGDARAFAATWATFGK